MSTPVPLVPTRSPTSPCFPPRSLLSSCPRLARGLTLTVPPRSPHGHPTATVATPPPPLDTHPHNQAQLLPRGQQHEDIPVLCTHVAVPGRSQDGVPSITCCRRESWSGPPPGTGRAATAAASWRDGPSSCVQAWAGAPRRVGFPGTGTLAGLLAGKAAGGGRRPPTRRGKVQAADSWDTCRGGMRPPSRPPPTPPVTGAPRPPPRGPHTHSQRKGPTGAQDAEGRDTAQAPGGRTQEGAGVVGAAALGPLQPPTPSPGEEGQVIAAASCPPRRPPKGPGSPPTPLQGKAGTGTVRRDTLVGTHRRVLLPLGV